MNNNKNSTNNSIKNNNLSNNQIKNTKNISEPEKKLNLEKKSIDSTIKKSKDDLATLKKSKDDSTIKNSNLKRKTSGNYSDEERPRRRTKGKWEGSFATPEEEGDFYENNYSAIIASLFPSRRRHDFPENDVDDNMEADFDVIEDEEAFS
jgi:hypothetical protein